MDFRFNIKLDNKLHKAAVHHPTPPAITLAVKNILYRHFKTDMIDLPYISQSDIDSFKYLGYMELYGVKIYGEIIDTVTLKKEM